MGDFFSKLIQKTGSEKLTAVFPKEVTLFDFNMKDIDG
jgi:hypothetical protein